MNSKRHNNINMDYGTRNRNTSKNRSSSSRLSDGSIVNRPHPSRANAKHRNKAKRILKRHIIGSNEQDQAMPWHNYQRIQDDIKWAMAVVPYFLQNYATSKAHDESTRESLVVKLQVTPPPRGQSPNNSHVNVNDDFSMSPLESPVSSLELVQQRFEPMPMKSVENPVKRSFADIARGRKIIGLIDNGNLEGTIPRSQWDWIQAALASVALEVLRENPGAPPSCTDAGWFQGIIKLIACDNDRSALLYKQAIDKIGEVYPGARLEVVDIVDIPSRPWATAWLPQIPSESADILEMLSALNPELPMHDWKGIKADKFEREMMLVIFQINYPSIEYLTRCDGLLNYGFNKIRMEFYKSPRDALSNLEAFGTAVDPPTVDDELDDLSGPHLSQDLTFLSDYDDSLD